MKEERKRILKMVEEGKLTVDEALTLLGELDKAQQQSEQKQEQITTELSTNINFEEANKEGAAKDYGQAAKGDPFFEKYQATKEKVFEFVETALKKIKELDLDLNFGQSVEINHIFQQNDATIKDIDIDVANGSIKLAAWDQPEVRIECQAKVYRTEDQDKAREDFLRDVNFTVEDQKLRFYTQQKWMKVESILYVPRAEFDRVRIKMFNGAISGGDLKINDLRVKTANGKIKLEQITGKKAEIETANGKIKLKKCQIDEIETETVNGGIKLEGDFKNVDAQSFNGQISFNLQGHRCEVLQARTTTGPIDLYLPEGTPVKGELKTNLGGFNLKLVGVQVLEEKSEVIQKSVRFQTADPQAPVLNIFAETKTGAISLQKSEE